jgi:hypothetical protein
MTPKSGKEILPLVGKFFALLIFILLATWGAHYIRDALNLEIMPRNEQGVHRAVMLGTVAYVFLLALPFVPGAEIGIALLTSFGASIAPLVYAATVVAMMLSYVIGLVLPTATLVKLLMFLRMRQAADLIARAATLPADQRVGMLLEEAPPNIVSLVLERRYIALAIAVNIPGNAVIGGGGGIMMMAGLSGIFAPVPTLIAILIGVSPVPFAVFFFGA